MSCVETVKNSERSVIPKSTGLHIGDSPKGGAPSYGQVY